jgi:hypothetical protein
VTGSFSVGHDEQTSLPRLTHDEISPFVNRVVRIGEGHEETIVENGLRLLERDAVLFEVADLFVRIRGLTQR